MLYGKFNRHGLRQLDDRALRCAVRGDQPRSEEGVHTANIDNLSPLTTHHRLGRKLREKENRIELGLDYIVPILRLLVQYTAAKRYVTGVIDQDADAAKLARDPAKCRLQCVAMGEIDLHSDRRNTDSLQFREHMLVLLVVSSQNCDGSASFGQTKRNAAT